VVIRHHTNDVKMLHEVFAAGDYRPPPHIARQLGVIARPRVVDLGANVGLFGVWMLTRSPDATIVAYEPEQANVAIHRRVIALNDAAARWSVRPCAASTRDGTVRFLGGLGSASRADDHADGTIDVPAVDAFDDLLDCDFVKIDIEGGEWPLLADPRFSRISAQVVVLEYHGHRCPAADPAGEAQRLLCAAGYAVHHVPKDAAGIGIVWGSRA
jgi:FkbM family methyltransferase